MPPDDVARQHVSDLFEQHARAVYRYVRTRLPPADADDIVAECFAVAWRRRAEVSDVGRPWLLAVARKLMANRIRADNREIALTHRIAAHPVAVSADHAQAVAEIDLAARALARLSATDQDVIALLLATDHSITALAQALTCSQGAAKVRVHRARKRLKAAMTDLQQGPAHRAFVASTNVKPQNANPTLPSEGVAHAG